MCLRVTFFLILCFNVVCLSARKCPEIFTTISKATPPPPAKKDPNDHIGRSLPPYWAEVAKKAKFKFTEKEAERRAVYDALALLTPISGVEKVADREVEVEFSDRWKVAARLFRQPGPPYAKEAEKWDRMEKIRTAEGKFKDAEFAPLRKAVALEFNRKFDEAASAYEALAEKSNDSDLWKDAARCYWRGIAGAIPDFRNLEHKAIRSHALATAGALEKAGLHQDAAEAYVRAGAWEQALDAFKTAHNELGVARMLTKLGDEKDAKGLFLKVANKFEAQNKTQEAIWAYREGGNIEKARALERQTVEYLKTASDDDIADAVPLGGGKNGTFLVTFKNGIQAVFKAIPNQVTGVSFSPDRATNEAKMWELDHVLGMDITPITIARTTESGKDRPLRGAFGSLQMFVHDGVLARNSVVRDSNHSGELAWFDLFAAHLERHDDNYFIRSANHVGIDNESAFSYFEYKSLTNREVDFEDDVNDVVNGTPPTRKFYDKLKAFTPDKIRATFGDFHADEMIDVRQRILALMQDNGFED